MTHAIRLLVALALIAAPSCKKKDGAKAKPAEATKPAPVSKTEPSLPATTTSKTPAQQAAEDKLAAELAANEKPAFSLEGQLRKSAEGDYEIDRNALERFKTEPSLFSSAARIQPIVRDGKAHGFVLSKITETSPFAQLGLADGDILRSVNGIALDSPEKALQAYESSKGAEQLAIEYERGGKTRNVTVTVVD